MQDKHLDRALAEEFSSHGPTIHKLKTSDPHFKSLMEQNHALWTDIQKAESNVTPASEERLEALRKRRLKLLDEIAAAIARAEK
jgi:uncharacterized protein YdcH (DUF465 family)